MERHYYRQYAQLERQHWWFTIRARLLRQILTQHLPAGIPPRILNVGCATGGSTLWLQQLGPVDSLEYDEECCRFCAEEVGIEVIQGSVLELPYESNQYDVVCAFDVIEHVDDHALAVTQLQRVCKPGGLVLISVPALMSLWSRHDEINQHYRRYRLSQLKHLLQAQPGTIKKATYFNSLLLPPIAAFRMLQRLLPKKANQPLKSDFDTPTPPLANALLKGIFALELPLLRILNLPLGVSCAALWQKKY